MHQTKPHPEVPERRREDEAFGRRVGGGREAEREVVYELAERAPSPQEHTREARAGEDPPHDSPSCSVSGEL